MNTTGSPRMDAGGTAQKKTKNGKLRIRWTNPDIFVTTNHHKTGESTQRIARVAGAGLSFFARTRARGEALPFLSSPRTAFKKINWRLLHRLLNETVFCRTL